MSTALLFVYGTLGPGQEAWSYLAPHAIDTRPATVAGRLYDTGRGYPAAVFGPGADRVWGWCCTLTGAPIAQLDDWEGDEYERIVVRTEDGAEAFAYHWRAPIEGLVPVPGGRWPDPDAESAGENGR